MFGAFSAIHNNRTAGEQFVWAQHNTNEIVCIDSMRTKEMNENITESELLVFMKI